MTFEEIRELLTKHFSQMLAEAKIRIATEGRLTDAQTSTYEMGVALAQDGLRYGYAVLPNGSDDLVDRFIAKYGLSLQPETAAYANLRTELNRGYRDYCSSVLEHDRSFETYQLGNKTNTTGYAPSEFAGSANLAIEQLIERYTKESNLGSQWSAKTQGEKADHFALLVELLGANRDVATISNADAHRVKETLIGYPRNRRKDPRTRDLILSDALKVEGVKPINVQTINKYIQTYGAMFGWAKRTGLTQTNVFEGLHTRISKKQTNVREAFTKDEAQTILRELVHNNSGLVRKDYQKWGALIAMYSGARLNEIAQIHLEDIRQEGGIWCFDLNDNDETKKLKTDASRRLVPIHSHLIALGLLDHVQKLRTDNVTKLFSSFTYCPKNGWGRTLGRWFNDQFLVKLGMKGEGVSFHVFRHTVVTRLRQASVDKSMVQALVGHEPDGVTDRNYFAAGYTLSQIRDAVEKLSFD